jgi:hypothetical protein
MSRARLVPWTVLASFMAVSCGDVGHHREAAAYSTAASLQTSVVHTQALDDATLGKLGTNWSVLSSAEYDKCVARLLERGILDTGRRRPTGREKLCDPWGSRFAIAIRRDREGRLDCIVWSLGKDGISGTSDDVICPINAQLPSR